MNSTVIIEVRKGRDSKLYPARMPTPRTERTRARWLVHNLVHRDHLSIRAAQRVMRDSYGVRRSVGQLWNDLHNFECEHCAPATAARAGDLRPSG